MYLNKFFDIKLIILVTIILIDYNWCNLIECFSVISAFSASKIKNKTKKLEYHMAHHKDLMVNQYLSPYELSADYYKLSLEQISYLDTKYNYDTNQTYNYNPNLNFNEWLAGFADGDSDFVVTLRKASNNINYNTIHEFRVTQSLYNLKCLIFIKDQLGCGQIRPIHPSGKIDKKFANKYIIDWVYRYSVQDKRNINDKIINAFQIFPLLTSKYFNFNLFVKMFYEKDPTLLRQYKDFFTLMPNDYKASSNIKPTLSWIVGFIEAEGSFFIKYDNGKFIHEFSISHTTDIFILEFIGEFFGITTEITSFKNDKSNNKSAKLRTNSFIAINNIINKLDNLLVGSKAFELKIWSDSFKAKTISQSYDLKEVQLYLRFLRNRHKVIHLIERKEKGLSIITI
jgi:hypothetical protein